MVSRPVLAAAAALSCVVVGGATAASSSTAGVVHHPHVNLVVAKGLVQASHGRLTGVFTVADVGRLKAAGSSASLSIRLGSKTRVIKRFAVPALGVAKGYKVKVDVPVPTGLPAGPLTIRACADSAGVVREGSESDNCRAVGSLGTAPVKVTPSPSPSPSPTPSPSAAPTSPAPVSTVPTSPVSYTKDTPFPITSGSGSYYVDVPPAYDDTHHTPITLLVWLHGCGGYASGDIYTVSPGGSQSYLAVAVGGREADCWNVDTDTSLVLGAIADVKTHFNINPRRVILGGYSSGGDLAYRTAFYNAKTFAGLLIENSSPFRDTGSTQSQSIAAAALKVNIIHLAHLQDTTYPIAGVRTETDALTSAGFPVQRIEVDGGHYDDPGAIENGHAVPGTNADLSTYLLSTISGDGWLAPAS